MKYLILLSSLMAMVTNAFASEATKCPPEAAITPSLPEATQITNVPVPVEDIMPEVKDLTPTEKLKAYRTELEKKNLVLLEKKMEVIRLQQEMALLRNLEKSMNKTLNAISEL